MITVNSETNSMKAHKIKRAVITWRKNPGNLSNAIFAAYHYANRDNRIMYIAKGNSYMHRVYHIVKSLERAFDYCDTLGNVKEIFSVDVDGIVKKLLVQKGDIDEA